MKINFYRFLACFFIFISFFFLYGDYDVFDSFYVSREVFGAALISFPIFLYILFKSIFFLFFSFLKDGVNDGSQDRDN